MDIATVAQSLSPKERRLPNSSLIDRQWMALAVLELGPEALAQSCP